ncbi:MAG: hypothetical protein J1F23_05035 [Oscillospiraceae bacterium]|nr:hypothetical protein [Oscillospiraceae bacterium]
MKKKSIFLFVLSIALIFATSINSALAYFTTYAEASGGYTLHLGGGYVITGGGQDIKEEFSDWTKRVTITNDPDGQPVFVRARAFSGSEYSLSYAGDDWTAGEDGYWYYDRILNGGENTTELRVRIEDIPADVDIGDHFNVVVIYETTPVAYDENGNPYADWNSTLEGE